jgi:hypothetical protein
VAILPKRQRKAAEGKKCPPDTVKVVPPRTGPKVGETRNTYAIGSYRYLRELFPNDIESTVTVTTFSTADVITTLDNTGTVHNTALGDTTVATTSIEPN